MTEYKFDRDIYSEIEKVATIAMHKMTIGYTRIKNEQLMVDTGNRDNETV